MYAYAITALLLLLPALGVHVNAFELPAAAAATTISCPADGLTDCTQAIIAAISGTSQTWKQIYLPAGTYLVSDRIDFGRFQTLRGAGPDKTIIKLQNRADNFQDPNNPRAVIRAWRGCCDFGGAHDNTTHSNHLLNMSIDVGDDNPGAVGVEFIAHNGGGIENVHIKAGQNSGVKGLCLERDANGPCLMNRITIEGFATGIAVRWGVYGTAFEDVTLKNQRKVGIFNDMHPIAIRKLTSINTVPAIQSTSTGYGHLVLLESSLTGGSAQSAGIETKGACYIRNCTIAGYGTGVKDDTKSISAGMITEYFSDDLKSGLESPKTALHLPVKDMYIPQLDAPENWVNVKNYAHLKNDKDWGPAFQAAIDAGKKTVFFPSVEHGSYTCNTDVIVRGAVRNIIGMYADMGSWGGTGKLIFETADPAATIYVEQMRTEAGYIHRSPATVVLRRSMGKNLKTEPGAGDLFVDDWCCGNIEINGTNLWSRQLNEESTTTKIVNNGGNVWILHYKTEQGSLAGHFTNGARTEFFGGLIYPTQGTTSAYMYINENSSFFTLQRTGGAKYQHFIKEIHDGSEQVVDPSFSHGIFYVSNRNATAISERNRTQNLLPTAKRQGVTVRGRRMSATFPGEMRYRVDLFAPNGKRVLMLRGSGNGVTHSIQENIAPGSYLVRTELQNMGQEMSITTQPIVLQ